MMYSEQKNDPLHRAHQKQSLDKIKTLKWAVSKGKSVLCRVKCNYGITPLIRTLVIRTANYPDRFGPSGKFDENSTKLASKLPVIGSSTVQCYAL
jgi:hypothetical protein